MEGGSQKPPDVVKSSETPLAEAKIRQDRQDARKALDSIGDLMRDQNGNDTAWNIKRNEEWGPQVHRALQEPKGSVTTEREEMVEPMSMLAWHALRRESPSMQEIIARETDPETQKINAESKQRQELARKAIGALMERYPDGIGGRALTSKARQVEAIGTLGQKLTTIGEANQNFADLGYRLDSLSRNDGIHPYRRLAEIDTLIEEVCSRMADSVHTAVESGEEAGDEQRYKKDGAEILPVLKSLLVLRKAMSKQTFGHEKSPNDVWALDEARWKTEEAATGATTTQDPAEPQPTGERTKVKSTFSAADMAEMRARAEAINARVGKGTETKKSEQTPQTPERQTRTFDDVKRELNGASIKTLAEGMAEAPALVTPEVKQVLLENMLNEIDGKINQAKRLNRRLGANIIGHVLGISADTKVYALPYLAAGGQTLPRGVKIVDYMRTAFGYDLHNDSKRAADLKQWTDMLE
ncbi:hypothetical protein A2501_02900 [Candidatus Uhrbacteria bacterium RIFOXYC12_FULL_57_11]|nr:MAG: hypothetical protein A2501_02900 [Candidatus Uhrbacteria bacterium RIFOXYC12_FULL_57_11]